MRTVLKTLQAARKKLNKRGAWCKDRDAFDRSNQECNARDRNAVKWCSAGAVLASTHLDGVARRCLGLLRSLIPVVIDEYNDHPKRRKSDIILLFDRAIRKARKMGI